MAPKGLDPVVRKDLPLIGTVCRCGGAFLGPQIKSCCECGHRGIRDVGPRTPANPHLMAETNILHRAYLRRVGSLIASSDQIRTVSRGLMDWIPDHPCPMADIDVTLSRMSRSVYNSLADLWVAMQRESGR